jgi:hypothetical protein
MARTRHYTTPIEIGATFGALSGLADAPPGVQASIIPGIVAAKAAGRGAKQAFQAAMGVTDPASLATNAATSQARGMPVHLKRQVRNRYSLRDLNPLARQYKLGLQVSLAGLDNTDGIWDDIVGVAKAVIPDHTVVGKLVNGDTAGAATDALKFAAQTTTPKPPPPKPLPVAAFQSLIPQTTTQKWMLGGAVALGGLLLLSIMRRRGPPAWAQAMMMRR